MDQVHEPRLEDHCLLINESINHVLVLLVQRPGVETEQMNESDPMLLENFESPLEQTQNLNTVDRPNSQILNLFHSLLGVFRGYDRDLIP